MGKQWKQWLTLFFWAPKSLQMVTATMKLKDAYPLGRKVMTNLDSILKNRDITLPTKVHLVKAMSCLFNSHAWMWELDYKEGWAPKNWCFWTVVLKILESPLDCKEIQPVRPKGDQSWVFIGRTDVESEAPILWPPDAESWLIEKTWCWERLRAGGEGDDRGRDGWMASPTQWTWVWVDSRSWCWTGRPGVLLSMGSQRVRYDWATELNWTELRPYSISLKLQRASESFGELVKTQIWASPLGSLTEQIYEEPPRFAFLTVPRWWQMLQSWGPHFENHCSVRSRNNTWSVTGMQNALD